MALITETYEGVPGGMNLNKPAQELGDFEARYLQDLLLHQPGQSVLRGPVQPIATVTTLPKPGTGLVQTLDPNGNLRIAALYGDGSTGILGLLSSDFTSIEHAYTWNGFLPQSPYYYLDAKAGMLGGVWIGTSSSYDADSPTQTLAYWRGANKPNYTTGTLSCARNSTTVTGSGTSWLSGVVPGSFLFANTDDPYTNAYIGIVKSVDSNTSITLMAAALHTATAKAYTATSIRGFCPNVVTGRITCTTGSTTVTGAVTKFQDQNVGTGVWHMYRASDLKHIGKVSAVVNNTSITLTANAAQAMNNERYYLVRADGDYSINSMAVANNKMGFINAVYSQRQWFANLGQEFTLTSRVWFSDTNNPESVDLSAFDGDFIDIASSNGASTPIRAMMPAYNALCIFKDNETFGIFGSSKSSFEVKKVEDDGVLSGMAVQPYGGGVVWAGREGIHYYDGIQAENIVRDTLGDWYKNAVRSFNPETHRMWATMMRGHYVLHIESVVPEYALLKGNVSVTPEYLVLAINMETRAVVTLTNVGLRGSVILPADSGESTWYLVNDATTGYICDSNVLFDGTGRDTAVSVNATEGPSLYMESKKYKVGDSMRKKLFKQLAINYLAGGGGMSLDTVVGLNNVGRTSNTTLPATLMTWNQLSQTYATWDALSETVAVWDDLALSVFRPKRIKFLKRSQHLSFRLYATDDEMTQAILGPFGLGFKLQRPGRI